MMSRITAPHATTPPGSTTTLYSSRWLCPHQCAEKYKAKVFPRMTSSPQTLPDLSKNSVPISSESGFGRQGKSFPSGSSPTTDLPSAVMTCPFESKMTREGIPRTLNWVLNDDFLSLR